MRFYSQPHRFYCGGDLHARTLDHDGRTRFERNLPTRSDAFLDAVQPIPAQSRSRCQEKPPGGTGVILRRSPLRSRKPQPPWRWGGIGRGVVRRPLNQAARPRRAVGRRLAADAGTQMFPAPTERQ